MDVCKDGLPQKKPELDLVPMKTAIIGAGAAGLCCARHFKRFPKHFQIHVIEQNFTLGGTWVYSPASSQEKDIYCHQGSSVYKNLRTNNPKECMAFLDHPFPSHLPSYVHHKDVLEYLNDYVRDHDIQQFIKFGNVIEKVKPIPINDAGYQTGLETGGSGRVRKFEDTVKWRVTSRQVKSGEEIIEDYDLLLVCNGKFFKPCISHIPGLSSNFKGPVVHSSTYREPEVYRNQDVLLIGAGFSARDLIVDLPPHARRVYVSNRGPPLPYTLPENVEELPSITKVEEDGRIHFTDDQRIQVDSIIFSTGYDYSFPFLTEETGIRVINGKRVTPLYKHAFNSHHPSMAFIGINFGYESFLYIDFLVRWVLSVWNGTKSLPSKEEMLKDENDFYQERLRQGLPPDKAGHFLGPLQWEMLDLLAELGGLEPVPHSIRELTDYSEEKREFDFMNFRGMNYQVIDNERWKIL